MSLTKTKGNILTMQRSPQIKVEQCNQRREEKGFYFFKMIHSSCIQDRRLLIPNMFIRNFGRELSDFVVLKVPSGKEWHVKLSKEEGRVWFQKGWDTFLDYHSICGGHVLVFKYDENSQFDVVICDIWGCEIEYPCDACNLKEANNETGTTKKRLGTTSNTDLPIYEQRTKISKNDPSCLLKNTEKRDEDTEKKRKYLVRNENKGTEQVGNDDVHVKVEKVAGDDLFGVNFQSYAEPIMFTPAKFIYTSDVGSKQDSDPCAQFVERPRAFIHDTEIIHKGCEVFGSIFKEISKEGPLDFDCLHKHEQTSSRPQGLTLMECRSHDSRQMKNVKGLQESSSLPNSDVRLHVSNSKKLKIVDADLYRSKKEDRKRKYSDLQPKQQTELVPPLRGSVPFWVKERSITEASAFTSENPFCSATMRPSYVNGNFLLHIPNCFAKTYLKDVQGVTLCIPGGREWPVQCTKGDYFVKLSTGWKAFVLDNQLAVDDICIFELVNRKLRKLKVSIFRVHQNSTPEKACVSRRLTTSMEEERRITSPSAFTSTNPFCAVTMQPSYVRATRARVNLPRCFAKKYLKDGFHGVTLSVSNRGKWKVRCQVRDYRKLAKGWGTFVVDNHLKENDVCIFELVHKNPIVLNVSIFRV